MTDERDVLIERYLAGAASPSETARLEQFLREDPRLLRDFVRALDEDVCLRVMVEGEPTPLEPRLARRASLRRIARPSAATWTPWVAVASVVMTALLLSVFYSPGPARPIAIRPHGPEPVEITRPEPAPPPAPKSSGAPEGPNPERPPAPARPELKREEQPEPPPPVPTPAPPKAPEPSPSPSTTVTAPLDLLRPPTIDEVQGEAFVVDAGQKTPARAGQAVPPGRGVSMTDASRLSVTFADGTRLAFSGACEIRELAEAEVAAKGARGKRVEILQGTLSADVKKQPAAQPMLVVTPHAQAQVLGTGFQLIVEAGEKGQTRLSVREGRVRFQRTGGKSADVAAGFEAAAAAGMDPVARAQDGSSVVLRPDLSLWLRSDQGVLLNGAGVSQWSDRSGNGRHAVQGLPVRQPLYVRAAQAGKPALRFDGADDFLSFPCPVTGLSGMTIFLVSSTNEDRSGGVNGSGNAAIFWHETENFGTVLLTPSPSKIRYFFGTGQSQAVFAYARPASIDRAWLLTTAEKSGTDAVLYVGGQEVFRQSGQKPEISSCEKVGHLGRGEGDKNTNRQFQGQFEGWTYFAGDIAEVLVYSRALAAPERAQVEQYLLGKYFPK
jgi:ferric-dicitrate binding protein FerR (iron transport regulator)